MTVINSLVAIVTGHNFLVCVLAWSIAQAIKLVWHRIRFRRWYFHMLVGTGGMPSSHLTFVSCFVTLMGLQRGWTDPVFQCGLVLALIVMSDAWGARRAAGRQAGVLNRLVTDFYKGARGRPRHLRELIGHTPLEVVAGSLLGITIAAMFWR
jgi:hypothetical protein